MDALRPGLPSVLRCDVRFLNRQTREKRVSRKRHPGLPKKKADPSLLNPTTVSLTA